MKRSSYNFKVVRVDGGRHFFSFFNLARRADLSYSLACKQGFDLVQLVRLSDGKVLKQLPKDE